LLGLLGKSIEFGSVASRWGILFNAASSIFCLRKQLGSLFNKRKLPGWGKQHRLSFFPN